MDYGFGKTYTLDSKFHALNGHVAFYEVETNVDIIAAEDASDLEKACAQANYLRLLETLRGAQPVIVKAEANKLSFVLEQAYTFAKPGVMQVSAHKLVKENDEDWTEEEKRIEHLFYYVDAEGEEKPAVKGLIVKKNEETKKEEIVDGEKALVSAAHVKSAF